MIEEYPDDFKKYQDLKPEIDISIGNLYLHITLKGKLPNGKTFKYTEMININSWFLERKLKKVKQKLVNTYKFACSFINEF